MLVLIALILASWQGALVQSLADVEAGRAAFEIHCGSRHGGEAKGGEYAPDIVTPGVALRQRDDAMREIA